MCKKCAKCFPSHFIVYRCVVRTQNECDRCKEKELLSRCSANYSENGLLINISAMLLNGGTVFNKQMLFMHKNPYVLVWL